VFAADRAHLFPKGVVIVPPKRGLHAVQFGLDIRAEHEHVLRGHPFHVFVFQPVPEICRDQPRPVGAQGQYDFEKQIPVHIADRRKVQEELQRRGRRLQQRRSAFAGRRSSYDELRRTVENQTPARPRSRQELERSIRSPLGTVAVFVVPVRHIRTVL